MIRATQKVIPSFAAVHMQLGPGGSTLAASSDFGSIKRSLFNQPFQIQTITQSDLASNINGFPTRQPSNFTYSLRTQHRIRNQDHLVRAWTASFGLTGFGRTASQQKDAKAATSFSSAVTCHRRHRTFTSPSTPSQAKPWQHRKLLPILTNTNTIRHGQHTLLRTILAPISSLTTHIAVTFITLPSLFATQLDKCLALRDKFCGTPLD